MHIKPHLTSVEEGPKNCLGTKLTKGPRERVLLRIVPHDFFVRGLASRGARKWVTTKIVQSCSTLTLYDLHASANTGQTPHPPACSECSWSGHQLGTCMFSAFDSGSECQITSRSTVVQDINGKGCVHTFREFMGLCTRCSAIRQRHEDD